MVFAPAWSERDHVLVGAAGVFDTCEWSGDDDPLGPSYPATAWRAWRRSAGRESGCGPERCPDLVQTAESLGVCIGNRPV